MDVGARFTELERYADLMVRSVAQLVGFEQDESQLSALNERYPNHKFISAFIGDGAKKTFYHCYYGGCSSFYRPDPNIINQFKGRDPSPSKAGQSSSPSPTKRTVNVPSKSASVEKRSSSASTSARSSTG